MAGTGGSDADGERKKRSGSNPKSISLELVYKSGGLEQKLVLSPAPSHPRKQGSEWLRALKKVCVCVCMCVCVRASVRVCVYVCTLCVCAHVRMCEFTLFLYIQALIILHNSHTA